MKKRAWIMTLLLIAACVGLGFFQVINVFYQRGGDKDFLVKAFNSCGALAVETNVNAYASNGDEFLNKGEITRIAKALAKGMELSFDDAERIENFSDDYNQISVIGKNSDGYSMAIIVHSMDFTGIDEGPGGYETNIVIDISLKDDTGKLSNMKDNLRALIGEHIEGVRITSCIVGSFLEELTEDDMENVIGSILKFTDGEETERAQFDGFLSVSAYTPHIDDYIEMGESRINLNVALRYNSYEERTYIWLGTPIIALEY